MQWEYGNVSRAVQELLLSKPLILASLEMQIINYSALARLLKKEVEGKLGRKVSEAAVKMAILRFHEQFTTRVSSVDVLKVIKESTASLIDDVGLLTLRGIDPLTLLSKALSTASRARLFQLTQGIRTLTIVTDDDYIDSMLSELRHQWIEAVYRDQAAVVLVSPPDIITTPGVIAYLTTLLGFHGVNITQLISTHTDTLFIVQRGDAIKAYTLLRGVIDTMRVSESKV